MALGFSTSTATTPYRRLLLLPPRLIPLFFFFLFLVQLRRCSSQPPPSLPNSSLVQGQSIKDGQKLLSAHQVFQLGFFSPGSSKLRYLGIWYYNVSVQTVVWVANRDSGGGGNGSLSLGPNGSLDVLDGVSGAVLWSSNTSTAVSATLLDTGNLVLQAADGTKAWQSFDHPTDTFLPGMRVSLNQRTGAKQTLTSWRSPDDPGVGNYSLGLDPSGSGQIFIWDGWTPRWRSGQWNGNTFVGTMMHALYIYGFSLNNNVASGIMYLTFSPANSSLLRFVLQSDGVENTSMLVSSGGGEYWEAVWVSPQNICEIYDECGGNGLCSPDVSPVCNCLYGFVPAASGGNLSSSGCVRRTQLQCELGNSSNTSSSSNGGGDGFYVVGGMKLPDMAVWQSAITDPGGCESYCSGNCSCTAYAFVENIGCLVWSSHLVDIYQFPQAGNGNNLYIKLAGSELGPRRRHNRNWVTILAWSLSSGFAAAILLLAALSWWMCRARIKQLVWSRSSEPAAQAASEQAYSGLQFSKEVQPDFSGPSDPGDDEGKELPLFTLDCIEAATDDFSDANKLGEGGFGLVYKGVLPGGEEVAIKRLSRQSGQGLEEFKNEVQLIAKLQHRNLVRILGCCIQGNERMLVYEYMPNKSLDAILFDTEKQGELDWKARFHIVEGIARGLLYLHRDSRLRIVHRDLKASNVLLDADMNPKISDFGMARIFGGDQKEANTTRLVGTYGYMSPEYAMEGFFSAKSDVYSFGILMLEIVTGRKNNSFRHLENSPNIIGFVWPKWNEGRAMEVVDRSIENSWSARQVLRCVHIGLLCVQDKAADRPDMSSVVVMLESDGAILRMPKQPTFTIQRDPVVSETFSANDLTVTIVAGR